MHNKIKILYLITGLRVGGAEILLWKFLQKINRTKFDPVIISFIPIGKIGRDIQKENIRIISLNIKKVLNSENQENKLAIIFRFFGVFLIEIPELIFLIKKEKPQILHSHLFHANLLGRIVGKICRVPIIISTIHNVNFGGKLREKLLRYTDKFCNSTVAISQIVAKEMIKKRVVPKNKLKLICNGIEFKELNLSKNRGKEKIHRELRIRKNQNILISVGRLTKQKGYFYMIKAVQILKKKYSDLIWVILGDGEDRKKLAEKIKMENLQKNIFFLGIKENVAEYLFDSDIFIMPSLWEGLPLSLLEAMACGLPVVATNVGGIPEVVEDRISGFLVEPKNPIMLAEKIEYLLNLDIDSKKKMGMEGEKIIENKFSLEKMVRNYENLYEKLLSKMK